MTAATTGSLHSALYVGRVRFRPQGSAGGHNGLNSIRESWGEETYGRLRFGIGKPSGANAKERVVGHVLGDFAKDEQAALPDLISKCCEVSESWVREGLARAMNRWNGK